MLQTSKPLALLDRDASAPEYISPSELFEIAVRFLRAQFPIIALVFMFTMALTAVYVFTSTPRYTAAAKMLIDTRKLQLFQQQPLMGDIAPDSGWVDSQVEILESENVALSVIKELHLTDDPEFTGPSDGLVSTIVGFVSGLFASQDEGPTSEFALTRAAVGRLEGELKVKRVGMTYIIEIDFRSKYPERAAQIANAVADAYVVDQLEAKYQATRRAGIWLQDRIKELREQASTADRAVVDFRTKNNIVESGGRLMNEQQLAEINSTLVQARALTAEAKARLERIDDILRMDVPDATVTDTLKNEVITKLRDQYLDFSRKEADWTMRYGRNHLAAVNMRNQMGEIRRNIIDELRRIAQSYRSDYEIAKAREDSLSKSLDEIVSQSQTTNQAQITLRDLESSAQTYRSLHDNFLQRYMESVQQQSFPITDARVITQASRPLSPSHPRTMLIMAAGAAGGLMLGFGLGFLRDISDRVFRTSDQIEGALHIDCITVLPRLNGLADRKSGMRKADHGDEDRRILERDQSIFWNVVDSPFSRFAESVRAIKLAADLNKSVKPIKVLGITSSLPNEGKSTVSMALAQSIANGGGRVILLDADLRNPGLSRKLTPHAELGLLDIIANTTTIEDAVWTDPATQLAFLPAVMNQRISHSSEVLASEAMKLLIERLRKSYDYIILDLSPLAPVVDVRAMTHLVDSFIFVVEWGRTKIDIVEHVLRAARPVHDNLLGVVLNKADLKVLTRYDSHRSNYYYNRYYVRYGYTD